MAKKLYAVVIDEDGPHKLRFYTAREYHPAECYHIAIHVPSFKFCNGFATDDREEAEKVCRKMNQRELDANKEIGMPIPLQAEVEAYLRMKNVYPDPGELK